MARHKTPTSLNDNLRLGRLTLPHWVALIVGVLSLLLWSSITSGVRDANAHLLWVGLPTLVAVVPILAFFRGGIERYPQQIVRYGVRTALVSGVRLASQVTAALRSALEKGWSHAASTYHTRRRHS